MKYTKLPLDGKQQIQLLHQRGMTIADEAFALEQLGIISYFRLAEYWKPMEADKRTHVFKPKSTFENAVQLYYFDKKLRNLLFSAIQSFEIAIRTKTISHVSSKYGTFWFLDETLFSDKDLFDIQLAHIKTEVKRSKEDFILEYFNKYTSPECPPVWKTLEVVSFGSLSKLITNLADKKTKKAMARSLHIPQHIYLESWIRSITILRNCIAHHARVWNRKFAFNPQMPKTMTGKWIADIDPANQYLYPLMCVLAYVENVIHPHNTFVQDFKSLLSKYPNVDTAAMGFPKDWEKEPLWRNV